ncbi:MAG: hypothetical protein ACOC98_09180, partial [Thermodesulfobacteriota bacterium]
GAGGAGSGCLRRQLRRPPLRRLPGSPKGSGLKAQFRREVPPVGGREPIPEIVPGQIRDPCRDMSAFAGLRENQVGEAARHLKTP